MVSPLYKRLKNNGTSFYAFPGAAEDISASHQNDNYRMYFSKYVLLNLPKEQSAIGGTQAQNSFFDFGTFSTISPALATSYSERVIESLRNYVANHEVSLRESRLNNTEYYYDTRALETTSEKIFWKWCKKLNLINWTPAIPSDEYFSNLNEFARINQTDDSYFPEYLWKERESFSIPISDFYQTSSLTYPNNIELFSTSAFGTFDVRPGDILSFTSVPSASIGFGDLQGSSIRVIDVFDALPGTSIIIDLTNSWSSNPNNTAIVTLEYNKLVRYIGEVNGISNVQEANRAYTEVYAHIPDHTGETPDILFRTIPDINYKPGLEFPIIPSQYQPEIIGAELFSSPIVSNPSDYPGNYYGQFDTIDFIYQCEPGDTLRRSGRFYGVSGDINAPVVDGSTIDGVTIDFNTDHYVKMNITDREVSTFDQFNALQLNNQPPTDFEFNAILWYYTVEDLNGNRRSNLYGISFLDNPDNNPIPSEAGIRFPVYQKLVTNGNQDGTSYAFGLNLNFNIIHDNPQEAYNPEAINSLFSMNLFNEAMRRLASLNDSFTNILGEQSGLQEEILGLKQLLYSQTDLNLINSKISNLESLLQLYSTQQIISSETIQVETLDSSPSQLRFNNIDTRFNKIDTFLSSNMYNVTGNLPITINPPLNKDFMINIVNDDDVDITLPNNDKLVLLINEDLSYKQTMTLLVTGTDISTQNKQLNVFINTINPVSTGTPSLPNLNVHLNPITPIPVETLLVGDINLPVFYNINTSNPNSAATWNGFDFKIDFNSTIILENGNLLKFSLDAPDFLVTNSINVGDELVLQNLFVGTTSIFNFSGQYPVDNVSGATVSLDVSSNVDFVSYVSNNYPLNIHTPPTTILSNAPYLKLNKGYIINITRISPEEEIPLGEKYFVDVRDINY
jgi:hypothetical protein